MKRVVALLVGLAGWGAVAAMAILVVLNIGSHNQVVMFLPILAGVVAAWAIGEVVTRRVFSSSEERL